MAFKLQFTFQDKESGDLDTIVADAAVSEGHSFTAAVTEFPVEKGAAVSDTVNNQPDRLRVEVFLSDFPLPNEGRKQTSSGAITQRPPAEKNRSQTILKNLIRLKETGTRISIETGLKSYKDMALETIEVPRDKSVKNAIRATLTFKRVLVVSTQTVIIAKERKGQPKKNKGPQTNKEATKGEKEKKGSLLDQAGHKGMDLFQKYYSLVFGG